MNVSKLKINELYQTDEYDCFEMHPHNRDLHRTYELELSMKKHGFIPAYPLKIERSGSRLIINAGHHRFYVAQTLGIPVWFVITTDKAELSEQEIPGTSWSSRDFVDSYTRDGNKDYALLSELKKRTGLPYITCASLLYGESANSSNAGKTIRHGSFKIKSYDFAIRVCEMVIWLKSNGILHARKSIFVGALSKIMMLPGFSDQQLKDRVLSNHFGLVNCATEKQFLENISSVYNFRSREKLPIVHMVEELMRERSPIGKK